MQNAGLDEAQAGIKTVRTSINDLQYVDHWTNGINEDELKGLLMRVKEKSKKARLNLKLKTKTRVTSPITSWQIEGEKGKQWQIFPFLGLKITVDGDCSREIKRCSLEIKLWLT